MNNSIVDILDKTDELLNNIDRFNDFRKKIAQLKEKVQKKEIVISVVGQFKRGKTTFINTILGQDILPVGIIPITSVVTKLKYGSPNATVMFNGGEYEEVSLDSLCQYISEQENPQNKKGVECVDIYYPCSILKEGIILVDTPGVGSIHKHNTDVAYSFLKDSDAVIFMLSVDSPINEIEREFLYSAKKYASKFYFAVNKIDMISEKELETYLKYCENVLCEIMGVEKINFYPISAKNSTGVENILHSIQKDIQNSIDDILIQSIKIKLKELIDNLLSQIDLYMNALKMPIDNLESKIEQLNEKLKDLNKITDEIYYRIERNSDSLIENVEKDITEKSKEIINSTEALLKSTYEKKSNEKPRKLEKELKEIIQTYLEDELEKMNDEGLINLKESYKDMTDLLNSEIEEIKAYISDRVYEIFQVRYNYEKTVYTLSKKEDYYVDVSHEPVTFFINTNDFIYFMPKGYANRVIYNKLLDRMKDIVERNKNNMIYNYKYKMRESLRSFKSTFTEEADNLQKQIKNTLSEVITFRENKKDEIIDELNKLNTISNELKNIL